MEQVRLIHPVYDPTLGTLLMEEGAIGTIAGYVITPGDPGRIPEDRQIIYTVDFITALTTTSLKLREGADFLFENGEIGKLNTIMVGATVDDVLPQHSIDSSDPVSFPTTLRFELDNGLNVVLTADRITGSLRVEFDADVL